MLVRRAFFLVLAVVGLVLSVIAEQFVLTPVFLAFAIVEAYLFRRRWRDWQRFKAEGHTAIWREHRGVWEREEPKGWRRWLG